MFPHRRCRIFLQHRTHPCRSVEQFAAAIGAAVIERFGAFRAEGAFERADERARCLRRKVGAAAFAIGAHFEHGAGSSGSFAHGVADRFDHLFDFGGIVAFALKFGLSVCVVAIFFLALVL